MSLHITRSSKYLSIMTVAKHGSLLVQVMLICFCFGRVMSQQCYISICILKRCTGILNKCEKEK